MISNKQISNDNPRSYDMQIQNSNTSKMSLILPFQKNQMKKNILLSNGKKAEQKQASCSLQSLTSAPFTSTRECLADNERFPMPRAKA